MQLENIYNKLVETMPNYTVRHCQLDMATAIDECFNNANPELADGSNIIMVEAPTGTGKSMAYLLAGIVNAKRLGKKLIITTATKALQGQLIDKDIPNLISHTGMKFNYALAKGRGNYLCPYQLELALSGGGELDLIANSQKEELKDVRTAFNNKGWDGDLDSLSFPINYQVKKSITTDKDRCLTNSCPYNQEDECKCPFYLNRAKLKYSEVIIANHSLLLADLTIGAGSILAVKPENYLLCVDEGHNLADVAVRSFSQSFDLKHTIGICHNLLNLIFNPDNRSYVYTDTELCDGVHDKLSNLSDVLEKLLGLLNDNASVFVEDKIILNDYLNTNLNGAFRDQFVAIAYVAFEIRSGLNKIIEKIKEQIKGSTEALLENSLNKLGFYLNTIETLLNTSQYIINQDDSRYNANAKWIELRQIKNSNNHEFSINGCMTHPGRKLFEDLWSKVYAGVVTSATLSIGNDFTYNRSKLGLNLYDEVQLKCVESSFNYKTQSQIAVPRFKYAPEYNYRNNFQDELVEYLSKNLDYDEGYGTLVLFFNRNQLIDVYEKLPKRLQKLILSQENYISNGRLLLDHKKRIDDGLPSIIFGLNSFAEGVDLPGLYCTHVIITKLPFETHKDPQSLVLEYWVRYEKGNYFAEVSLPEACIRLIQASGRLIRSDLDYGQLSICDNRLVTKDYGRLMLDALPNFNRKYDESFLNKAFLKIKEENK